MALPRAAERYATRLRALRQAMREQRLNCFFVSRLTNVRYLCGFSGSSGWLAVFPRSAFLLTDSRYELQVRREVAGAQLALVGPQSMEKCLAAKLRQRGTGLRVGFEADHLTYSAVRRLRRACRGQRLVAQRDLVGRIRRVKDELELRALRRAVRITDQAFARVVARVRAGMTEREIEFLLNTALRELGAEPAFPIIVAGGPNAALPHAQPSGRRLRPGDFLLVDMGARIDGYHADMTRTCIIGKPRERQKRFYRAVLAAQLAVIAEIRPGARAKDLYRIAQEAIAEHGLADVAFRHGLGHGVGLDIHEGPSLGAKSNDVLQPGMVVTVEPGVYDMRLGGVRIEDIVLVTETGCTRLTRTPRPAELPTPRQLCPR